MSDKIIPRQYKSKFVHDLDITVAEYITEILISNFCSWQKISVPQRPFWKKEYQSTTLDKELAKRYIAEISYVHDLLKVFSPSVITEVFSKANPIGLRLVKVATREKIIYKLYEAQAKYIKSLKCIKERVSELERIDNKLEFVNTNAQLVKRKKDIAL